MVVDALVKIAGESTDKRMVYHRHPLIKNAEKILIDDGAAGGNQIPFHSIIPPISQSKRWFVKRMPVVTTALRNQQHHHVHLVFEPYSCYVNLSMVRPIARKKRKREY